MNAAKARQGGQRMTYTCDECEFTFFRTGAVSFCPRCDSTSFREATEAEREKFYEENGGHLRAVRSKPQPADKA